MNEWPEILLIDKPKGISSFDVIRRLRKQWHESRMRDADEIQEATDISEGDVFSDTASDESREVTKKVAASRVRAPKMGHAGTLDPLATGLMIIGVGKGTKQLEQNIKLDKEYVAEVLIGKRTTTGDLEGEVTKEKVVEESAEILQGKISAELKNMTGTITLPVSAFSAIKKDGVPMYKRARKAAAKGEEVTEVPMRDMVVHETELISVTGGDGFAVATVRFHVGSGTYIRSLGEELGKRLGYPATLQNLRRTKIGTFDIKEAQKIEEI